MNTTTDSAVIDVEYEQPACPTQHAWARVPVEPGPKQRAELKDRIRRLLISVATDLLMQFTECVVHRMAGFAIRQQRLQRFRQRLRFAFILQQLFNQFSSR